MLSHKLDILLERAPASMVHLHLNKTYIPCKAESL